MDDCLRVSLRELAGDGVTLFWNEIPGAARYRVCWTDRDTPAHLFKPLPPVAGTAFRLNKATDIPYYVKVQALDGGDGVLAESRVLRTPVGRVLRPQLEELGRGLTAVCTGDGVFLSWRLLRGEVSGWSETGLTGADFRVYKNGRAAATVTDRTSWRDPEGTAGDRYAVAAVYAGKEQAPCAPVSPWAQNYIDMPLHRPEGGTTPAGEAFTYHAGDVSVGDVDGDGAYEFVVQWDPSNAHDVSHRGYTGRCILDCCRLDGTLLWRLDLGPNIRAGAHYTQFMVYDFNGDGRAEMALKTAPGTKMTRFAPDGTVLSEAYITMPPEDLAAGYSNSDNYVCSAEDYRAHLAGVFQSWHRHPEVLAGHWPATLEACWGIPQRYPYPLCREDAELLTDYFIREWAPARDPANRLDRFEGFIYEGPEYLTMFDGMGRELETIRYEPGRTDDGLLWGDYAWRRIEPCNRVDRFLAGVAYLDGERPYLLMCRGYYTRSCVVAYDFFQNRFHEVWRADSGFVPMDNPFRPSRCGDRGGDPVMGDLAQQGNHSLSTADVDGDGCMEVIYGAAVLDHDGSLLYSARGVMPDGKSVVKLGHGDAIHVADIDPDRPGKEIFSVFEGGGHVPYGYALRDAETGEIYFGEHCEGDLGRCMIGDIAGVRGLQVWVRDVMDCKGRKLDVRPPSTNMRVFWAGDLTTQHTDGADYMGEQRRHAQVGRVWDARRGLLLEPEGTVTNHHTKGVPCLVADIFGDWREELLLRLEDDSAIRIYTSVEDAPHKLFTLMHDPQYRCGAAWQNNCYNQPVYPSFYYASDMEFKNVLPGRQYRPVLYLAGDSTMQSYGEDESLCGWGQVLAEQAAGAALCTAGRREGCPFGQERRYALPELIIDNCAIAARTTGSFLAEGRLDDAAGRMGPGDFLLVQFGHNDCDRDQPQRRVSVERYVQNLGEYLRTARARGAQLILTTPVPPLRGKSWLADLGTYAAAMAEFARDNDVPCLDLYGALSASLEALGRRRSAAFYQPDEVHLTGDGARHAAALWTGLLRESGDRRLGVLKSVFCI